MNEPAVYYHWFGASNESPPYSNMRAPIIVSIATLRAVSDIPIIVMDVSEHKTNWSDFPNKLNFQVTRPKCQLSHYKGIKGWQHLSRLFDLEKYAQHETVIYSDSDVFWLLDPKPLLCNPNQFCFDGYNTGFFYYNPLDNNKFFELFKAYTISAINSPDIRNVLMKHVGYQSWYYVWDEMITTYIAKEHPELVNIIPPEEHGSPRRLIHTDLSNMKNLHLNGVYVKNPLPKVSGEKEHCRGLAGIIFSEFYEKLQTSLGNDIDIVFTKSELQIGLKHQFSLLKDTNQLLNTLRDDGHYELSQKNILMV